MEEKDRQMMVFLEEKDGNEMVPIIAYGLITSC